LKDGDRAVTRNENLLELGTNYYKSPFGPGPGNIFEINPNLWQDVENVNAHENEDLTKPNLSWRKKSGMPFSKWKTIK
jgi:hypothetical protein